MRYEKRVNKDGSHYYSFITSDRKRISRKEIKNRFGKDVLTEEDAKRCLKLLDAEFELKKFRIKKRLEWQDQFYNFSSLLDQYEEKQKKTAPRSYENNVFYLKHYVLHYFLTVKSLNNIELWQEHYTDFTEWLETAKRVNDDRVIAYSSKNHAIKSLNTFMNHLYRNNIISAYKKCPTFPEHLLNSRTYDDVISDDELNKVVKELNALGHHKEALLYKFLFHTGMRFHESLAISVADIFQGNVESEFFHKKMEMYNLSYYGYIVLSCQYGGKDKNGEIIRLPLKGKKKIEEKHNRTIPISSKDLWNDLVDCIENIIKKDAGRTSRKDLLIFDGVDDATATRKLKQAFSNLGMKYKTWHLCRHSYCTTLVGKTSDLMLVRSIVGHTSAKTLERYNHIFQALTRDAKNKAVKGSDSGLKKV